MKRWLPCALLVVLVGCGGGSPTGPTPPPSGPATPTNLHADFTPALGRTSLSLSWSGTGPFLVDIGTSPGASDVGSFASDASSFTANDLPTGRLYCRVRAHQSESSSAASSEVSASVFDLREYVEALFFATGSLTPTDGNLGCAVTNIMRGWPRGTTVTLLVSSSVTAASKSAAAGVAAELGGLTHGVATAAVADTVEADPQPQRNQSTLTIGDPSLAGCPSDLNGCSVSSWETSRPAVFIFNRTVVAPNAPASTFRHEVGHGLLGLCHIDAGRIGGSARSLMSAGPENVGIAETLSPYDRSAIDAVYGAGMEPGRTRADFAAAGLIR